VLQQLARDSSTHERRAMEAEREAVSMYRAYLMRDQVGVRFKGVVSAVTSFGAFVEIEEPFVEGLIKLEALGDEPFSYDEVHMRLSGKKTGKMIELGDEVEVEIQNVSVVRRRIDFTIVGTPVAKKKSKRHGAPEQVVDNRAPRGIAQRKRAGREVERAVREHADRNTTSKAGSRGAKPAKGGKLRLGVSHRGMGGDGAAGGGGAKKKKKPR
jgi:ribonuclease R